jgi:dihydroorotate dehydrogenase electron transfer subunit
MGRMAANRVALLVSREVLPGPYALLSFRHIETAREAAGGQFVMIKAGTCAEPPLRRPFSVLATDPAREIFSVFVKAVGACSRALTALSPGEPAQCLGPLGRPFTPPPPGVQALLVAGGYGVAPFRLFAAELRRLGRSARLYYGGRAAADLPLHDRFPDLDLVLATEDGSLGHRGRVTEPLAADLAARTGPVRLYACGPEAMLHAVARLAAEHELAAEASLDPWMGCGIGTCLGCVVSIQDAQEARPKYRCACTEGPVFDAERVVWPGEASSAARRRALRGAA